MKEKKKKYFSSLCLKIDLVIAWFLSVGSLFCAPEM